MSRRLLIRHGCILTLGTRTANLPVGDLLIEEDRIVEIGVGLRARDAEVIDATDTIVMPGFVDTHRHVWRSLFRNAGVAGTSDSTSREHFRPEDIYAATMIGLFGALEAGITTVVDFADIDHRFAEAALQAHADAGPRTVFVTGSTDQMPLPSLRRLNQERRSMAAIAYGAADSGDPDRAVAEWTAARELGLRIHAHTGPLPGYVSALAARRLLGVHVTLIHGSHLSGADLDAVSSSGAGLSITPAAEMAGGMGPPPMQELINRGIRPGLGIDDEQVAPGDMFAQMRAAISIQHATVFDLKLAGKAGLPHLLTTRDVIRYATVEGAKAVGLAGMTGSLEPGKQADLLLLRVDRPNIAPVNDPIGAVVWGMDTSNIDWVIVGGRPLVRNGVSQADLGQVRDLAAAAQQRVAAAGLAAATSGGGL